LRIAEGTTLRVARLIRREHQTSGQSRVPISMVELLVTRMKVMIATLTILAVSK